MRRLLRFLVFTGLALVALAAALWWIVAPPAPLALPPQGAVLEDVVVVRPGEGRAAHERVVVSGGAIERIEPAGGSTGPFAGMYVLPGLNDLHVHFPPGSPLGQTELFAFLFLYHGVTGVRDAGDVDGTATAPAREGVAAGRFPGPRIRACGRFVDGDPPLWRNTQLARNAAEGRAAVEALARDGFDCIKAYNELDAETLAAIREAAHARGLPVIGHVPRRLTYEAARLDDVQHFTGVPPRADPSLRFPFLLRAWDDFDDARLEQVIGESLRSHIANTPTLVTLDRLVASEDPERVGAEPDALLLPRMYRDVVWSPRGGTSVAGEMDDEDFAMVRRALAASKRTLRAMAERGVELHTGTDTLVAFVVPGASLHRELRIWADAGLTPEQALAASTQSSAAALGVPGLGELRAGAPAELVIFRDDPTASLAALDSIAGVVRDGRLYTRAALDAQLARYRAHFDGALYDALVTPLIRRMLARTRG